MALEFAPPSPTWNVDVEGSTQWTVTGNENQLVSWRASNPNLVSLTPQGTNSTQCVIKGLKPGQVMITASADHVASTSKAMFVGGILAYGPDGQLYGTYAKDWIPVSTAEGIPTAGGMTSAGYGFAFVPPTQWTDTSFNVTCYLISIQVMSALVPPDTATTKASISKEAVDYDGPLT